MADFYLSPDPLFRKRTDPVEAFGRGYGMVQDIQKQNILLERARAQQQQQQAELAAKQQYGQTGDPTAFRGVDPMMEAKLTDWLQKQPPEVLKDLPRATAMAQQISPMLNSQSWKGGLRQKFVQGFPNLPKDTIPPENATDAQLFQWANASKILDAQLKIMGTPGKISSGYYQPPGGGAPVALPPTAHQQAQERYWTDKIEHDWAKLTQDRDKETKGGPYNQLIQFHEKLRLGQPVTEESLKDLFGSFSKSGLNVERQADRDAYKAAISVLGKNDKFRDLSPDSPEYDAMLRREVERQKGLVRGTGGRGAEKDIWKPGTPTASGFQGPGRYRINGQEMVINSEDELKRALGQ